MSTVIRGAALVALAVAAASASFAGCSAGRGDGVGSEGPPGEATGTIGLRLTIPGGEAIASIAYAIDGPHSYSGTVNVSGTAPTFRFVIPGVAPGSGYTITLTATSVDGTVACTGTSAPFSVAGNQTTAVNVLLACTSTIEAGAVVVDGTAFDCATWHTAIANPASTTTGGAVALVGWATAPDPAALTYRWSAPAGTIADPASAATTFTCPATPRDVPITLTVADGPVPPGASCPAASSTTALTVTCASAIDGGAPGQCDGHVSLVTQPALARQQGFSHRPAIADMNGDGVLDFAVGHHGDGIDVFVATGTLVYSHATGLGAGGDINQVNFGDMDGDGKLDLVAADYGRGEVIVFLGRGDGTFGAPIETFVAYGMISGVLDDFDGDGRLDVAMNSNFGPTAVLVNQGGGHLAVRWSAYLGANPHHLTAADFNGDGKPDLAVASYFDGLKIVLNQGDGTMGPATSPALAPGNLGDVVHADFDRDGRMDLAIVTESHAISVLLNDGTPFSTHAEYPVSYSGPYPPSDAIAALDLDGKLGPDLVVAGLPSSLAVRLNNGDGTFGAEMLFPTSPQPGWLEVGDMNADGRPDIVGVYDQNLLVMGDSLAIVIDGCTP